MNNLTTAKEQPYQLVLLGKYNDAVKDNFTLVKSANEGLNPAIFYDLVSISGKSKNQLAEDIFGISVKTIQRYTREDKKLGPRNTELALKLVTLYKKGIEIFGGLEHFISWLDKPAYGLGALVPYQLMNTATGIDLILEELIRIEYGDLA